MSNKDHLSLAEPTFSRSVPYSPDCLFTPNSSGSGVLLQNNFLTPVLFVLSSFLLATFRELAGFVDFLPTGFAALLFWAEQVE